MTGQPDRVVTAARALRLQVIRRLAAERTTLAALEQEERALEDTIALMEGSAGRRAYLSIREKVVNALTLTAHPVWTAGVAARAAAGRRPLRDVIGAFRHLRRRALPLRFSSPTVQRTDQAHEFVAIRWVGPVSVRRETFESLLCHPASLVEYRVRVRAGARFATACAISPHVWPHRPGPAVFRIRVQVPAIGWEASREARLDSRRL